MKVALVHDWLTGLRGGERCLLAFLKLYPQADIFTLVHVPGATSVEIDSRVKETSFLNKFPNVKKYYRALLPLFPLAVRKFDFSEYDLVISLSHAAAKNIKISGKTKHISYCFTPMRYIWDQAKYYLGNLRFLAAPLIYLLRKWDLAGNKNVDQFVAISKFVEARIRCFYSRSAKVIYPPVETNWIPFNENKSDYFLYAGALVPYKRPELVIEAFNKIGEKLIVVGKGSELEKLKKMAKANISFVGAVNDQELADYYSRARALIFPGIEDFGMVPIEALAAGTPVIGLYAGGVAETINAYKHWQPSTAKVSDYCGVFIENKSDSLLALIEAVQYFIFKEQEFSSEKCLKQSELFSAERFFTDWNKLLSEIGLGSIANCDNNQDKVCHA